MISRIGADALLLLVLRRFAALLLIAALVACGDADSQEDLARATEEARASISLDSPADGAGGESAVTKPAKPQIVGFGQRLDLQDYVVSGQYTVVDFYSDYCGPCKQMAPYLEKLHEGRSDVTVVKVDINRDGVRGIDWRSPVARQYNIGSVPYLRIYDPSGNMIADGRKATNQVGQWLRESGLL